MAHRRERLHHPHHRRRSRPRRRDARQGYVRALHHSGAVGMEARRPAEHRTDSDAVQRQQSSNSDQASGDGSSNSDNIYKGLQRRLTQLFHQQTMKETMTVLESAGVSGRLFLAQLRSQRAPFAMAWLGQAGLAEMSTVETATMLLISLGIEPWGLQTRDDAGAELKCCFCGIERPTAVHMMGCSKQHIRGHNAVHTGQKRYVQHILRRIGYNAHEVYNELGTMYTVPVGQQQLLQADTALARGSLALCGDETLARQGVVLDSSVTAATTAGNLAGATTSSASVDGYASARREAEKHRKHTGRYVTSRWRFVPFVQEAHGRLGREAAEILGYIATEASQRSGGNRYEIASKRSRIITSLKSGLSTSLAVQMAQRIFGHVRGSAVQSNSL